MADNTATVTTTTIRTTTTTVRGASFSSASEGTIPHEQTSMVALLCTRSQFHLYWEKNQSSEMEKEMVRLGLSDPAQELLVEALASIDTDQKNAIIQVAKIFGGLFYDGDEPHPPREIIAAVVTALRALDGN